MKISSKFENSFVFPKKLFPSKESLFLFLLSTIFILINIIDLKSWYYSIIGDEYAFYHYAKNFQFGKEKIFSQAGVYGYHPILSSFYQALIMKTFGENNFGWRLSSLLIIPFSLPGFYLLTKELFDRRVATFSSIIFCFSFYFFAYAHLGYNNLQAIFPFVYGLYFAILSVKKPSYFFAFLSGCLSGLGWYTFYTARITIFIVLGFYFLKVIFGKKSPKPRAWFPVILMILGFAATIAPLLITSGQETIGFMKQNSVLNPEFKGSYLEDPWLRWLANFKINSTAFMTGEQKKHFLRAPLVGPLTGILILLGFGKIFSRIKKSNYFFLLLAYLGTISMVSFNPIEEIVVSRLHLSILLLTIIGGIGWKTISRQVKKLSEPLNYSFNLILAGTLLFINLNIFFKEIPQEYSLNKEALIIKTIQFSNLPVVIYEGSQENSSFREIIKSYSYDQKVSYLNDSQRAISISRPFLFLDNSKNSYPEGNSLILGAKTENNLSLICPRLKELETSDFTDNKIIVGYCY